MNKFNKSKVEGDDDGIDTLLVRIEQIAPFPYDLIVPIIKVYPNSELIWAQEEPKNMGAWNYIKPRFQTLLNDLQKENQISQSNIRYVPIKLVYTLI